MKKIIMILVCIMFASPCLAFQNYILMTDKEITDIKISDENIITVRNINSFNNTNSSIMILPKNIGTTNLYFKKGTKNIKLSVKVKPNETCITRVNGVNLVPVDLPPELK